MRDKKLQSCRHDGHLFFFFFAAYTWTQLSEVLRLQHVSPWPKHCSHSGGGGGWGAALSCLSCFIEIVAATQRRERECVCFSFSSFFLPPSRCSRCFSAKPLCSPCCCCARLTACKGPTTKHTQRGQTLPEKSHKKKKSSKLESSEGTQPSVRQLYSAFSLVFLANIASVSWSKHPLQSRLAWKSHSL